MIVVSVVEDWSSSSLLKIRPASRMTYVVSAPRMLTALVWAGVGYAVTLGAILVYRPTVGIGVDVVVCVLHGCLLHGLQAVAKVDELLMDVVESHLEIVGESIEGLMESSDGVGES